MNHCNTPIITADFSAMHDDYTYGGFSYRLISGPGEIDTVSGHWKCNLAITALVPGTYTIVVEAVAGPPKACSVTGSLALQIINRKPELLPWIKSCDDTVQRRALDTLDMYWHGGDPDPCDKTRPYLESVTPETDGKHWFDTLGRFYFVPARTDSNQTFRFVFARTDGFDTSRCGFSVAVTPAPAPYELRIPVIKNAFVGQPVKVPILLDTASQGLRGFDLLIWYDNSMLTLLDADVSDSSNLLAACAWEYFTYRYVSFPPGPSNIGHGLRLVGIAETGANPNHPTCYSPATYPATLVTLSLLVANYATLECLFLPIKFVWGDCMDNGLIRFGNPLGDTRSLSLDVVDSAGQSIAHDDLFPTFSGAPTACDSAEFFGRPVNRFVIFQNGGIGTVCADSIDTRGDINLNGVPYEIADMLMFRNYYLYGIPAFAGHFEGSQAASDVNGDGLTLTLEDFVAFKSVVLGTGTGSPWPQPSANEALAHCNITSGVVTIETPDTLGAVHLVFAGQAMSISIGNGLQPSLDFNYNVTTGSTEVIVCNLSSVDTIMGETQVTVIPPLPLFKFECATFDGKRVKTVIDSHTAVDGEDPSQLPTEFAVYQNYPNPFNATTKIAFDLPKSGMAKVEIVNALGQMVRSWQKLYGVGKQNVEWNGLDNFGHSVASGIYYYRISSGTISAVRKMVLLK